MTNEPVPYESYLHLIQQVDGLIHALLEHPDPATREQVGALLTGLDMLHHEALGRLVAELQRAAVGNLLEKSFEDPVIRTLFGLYGLAELDLPAEPSPVSTSTFVPVERLTVGGVPVTPHRDRT